MTAAPRPFALVAELTHACPLRCAYCSNPLDLVPRGAELDTAAWRAVLAQAEALGVVQVTLTGGEPLVRDDLEAIAAEARRAGLYTTLITSGIPHAPGRITALGVDAVQLSMPSDEMAGVAAHERKLLVAAEVRAAGLPLTLNVVLHAGNAGDVDEIVALAERLGARRLELATTQHLGWALANRAALLAPADVMAGARAKALAAKRRLSGQMEVIFVAADHHAGKPRACMGGWGSRYLVVAPDGAVLPCHAARSIRHLQFEHAPARDLGEIWAHNPALNAYRGEAWMKDPCKSCDRRADDFGGCRCQAYALTGDPANADPACDLSPHHELIVQARTEKPDVLIPRLRR